MLTTPASCIVSDVDIGRREIVLVRVLGHRGTGNVAYSFRVLGFELFEMFAVILIASFLGTVFSGEGAETAGEASYYYSSHLVVSPLGYDMKPEMTVDWFVFLELDFRDRAAAPICASVRVMPGIPRSLAAKTDGKLAEWYSQESLVVV